MSEPTLPPAGNPFPPVRPDGFAWHVEPIIEPDDPVVDARRHFFDWPISRHRFDDCFARRRSAPTAST